MWRCMKCDKVLLDENKIEWLELSQTDGKYYTTLPEGHVSQGGFPFGRDCARNPNEVSEAKFNKLRAR